LHSHSPHRHSPQGTLATLDASFAREEDFPGQPGALSFLHQDPSSHRSLQDIISEISQFQEDVKCGHDDARELLKDELEKVKKAADDAAADLAEAKKSWGGFKSRWSKRFKIPRFRPPTIRIPGSSKFQITPDMSQLLQKVDRAAAKVPLLNVGTFTASKAAALLHACDQARKAADFQSRPRSWPTRSRASTTKCSG
jgi:hypothetical protein